MTDYRKFFDKDYIGSWDLEGKDVTLVIDRVEGKTLTAPGGAKSKKPVIFFKGTTKGMALNVTNGKTIAGMYGSEVNDWAGKRITIFPTTTTFGAATVECIRVRPKIPSGKTSAPPSEIAEAPTSALVPDEAPV